MVDIHFMKLHKDAQIPQRATDGAAGYDLYTVGEAKILEDPWGKRIYEFYTGLAVELPKGYFLALYPRSSLSKKGWAPANSVGVVDEDYRGEIRFLLRSTQESTIQNYPSGTRLVQAILQKYEKISWKQVEKLNETSRGFGGFGSTDNKNMN